MGVLLGAVAVIVLLFAAPAHAAGAPDHYSGKLTEGLLDVLDDAECTSDTKVLIDTVELLVPESGEITGRLEYRQTHRDDCREQQTGDPCVWDTRIDITFEGSREAGSTEVGGPTAMSLSQLPAQGCTTPSTTSDVMFDGFGVGSLFDSGFAGESNGLWQGTIDGDAMHVRVGDDSLGDTWDLELTRDIVGGTTVDPVEPGEPIDADEPAEPDEPGDGAESDAAEDGPSEEAMTLAVGAILMLLGGAPLIPQLRAPRTPTPPPVASDESDAAFVRRMLSDTPLDLGRIDQEQARRRQAEALRRYQQAHVDKAEQVAAEAAEASAVEDQRWALQDRFAEELERRRAEGYYVRNATNLRKVWSELTDREWGEYAGQCGEFAAKGEQWSRAMVQDVFGPDAQVDQIVIQEASTVRPHSLPDARAVVDFADSIVKVNHAATRVILPNGERYVLDYWEYLGRSSDQPPRLIPEHEWVERWSDVVGEPVVQRGHLEDELKQMIERWGYEEGTAYFLQQEGWTPVRKKLIRSWEWKPW